jgi:hypothetical protein
MLTSLMTGLGVAVGDLVAASADDLGATRELLPVPQIRGIDAVITTQQDGGLPEGVEHREH